MSTKLNQFLSFCFLILICLSVKGQIITDSILYSELSNQLLSNDGKWATIRKHYNFDIKNDTTFIVNTNGKVLLKEKTIAQYKLFSNDLLITYNSSSNSIIIFDPNVSKRQLISNVSDPIYINNHSLILYLDIKTNKYNLVKITKDSYKLIWSQDKKLIQYLKVSDNQEVLFAQKNSLDNTLEIINLQNFDKTINHSISYPIKHVFWDKKYPIAFISPNIVSQNNYPFITFLNYKNNFVQKQILDKDSHFTSLEALNETSFKIKKRYLIGEKSYNPKELEIWSTNDLSLNHKKNISNSTKLYGQETQIYNYSTANLNQLKVLKDYETIKLNSNTLLLYNPNQYHDYTNSWNAKPRDFILYDIDTQKTHTIVKALANPSNTTSISPLGGYFVYYQNDSINFYNVQTKQVENSFKYEEPNAKTRVFREKIKYWSDDEKFFFFNSNSNLLKYNTLTKKLEIIKENKSKSVKYSILNKVITNTNNNSDIHSITIQDYSNLLIASFDVEKSTFSLIKLNKNQERIIIDKTKNHISRVIYSKDFKTITYALENHNMPKDIYVYKDGTTKLLLENGMPQSLFNWKKQKTITYKDRFNNSLKGILYYPKDFNTNKKYPMITHIYELQNHLGNRFTYPTFLNNDGYNTSLLQENNYFVFLPDILDTNQGTGLSALHCVEESIKTVLQEEKSIDKENLGLFGFSHGGYETNFIITQTDLFKAAVSGSGNVDLIRSYFSYNENFISPFFFQFENGQYKMPKTFKEDKELYIKNSPIMYVDKIKTPLLTFTGKQDENIHWGQSRELFIGMLRYNIPHIALFYKNEGHGLIKKVNQIDITKRTMSWFNYFLKDENSTSTNWIINNTYFDKERILSH
ncbi:alpha/beta hydrolase family protein [Myroides profundi]|uniref:Prolyl oligopeptidase family protein n=1 Tax=Myroides profundi TaxID=480520 RepID=A0AAJ5BFE5_MYRPR|nr:prolyl oligopeptidase family serine peptidase [Myroides profundi]AJH14483.1 peptidase S9 prolyl oligopeptidase [Myroides profundi]SER58553.1 Prolyl oligopeptidase family protein [Myroides profundi]